MTGTEQSTAATIVTGGVTATAIVFFHDTITAMIPYLIAAVPLVLLDLNWGVKAARHRGEKVRFSKGFRKTIGKCFEYVCWITVSATLSLAFGMKWLEWVILGAVVLNELASIVGNYAETKNVEISWAYLWNKVLHIGGQKAGLDTTEIDVGELVKPKQPRNEKGQFVKKEE